MRSTHLVSRVRLFAKAPLCYPVQDPPCSSSSSNANCCRRPSSSSYSTPRDGPPRRRAMRLPACPSPSRDRRRVWCCHRQSDDKGWLFWHSGAGAPASAPSPVPLDSSSLPIAAVADPVADAEAYPFRQRIDPSAQIPSGARSSSDFSRASRTSSLSAAVSLSRPALFASAPDGSTMRFSSAVNRCMGNPITL